MLYFVLNEMQYIFSQVENDLIIDYDEYMRLKKIYSSIPRMSKKKEKVYNCYLDNPGITYEEASKFLQIQPSAIHKHIVDLEKMGYVKRDSGGKVNITPTT